MKILPGGLIYEEIKQGDWIFGSDKEIGGEIKREDSDWRGLLPAEEYQRKINLDDYGCVTHSAQNEVEVDMIYELKKGNKTLETILKFLDLLDDSGKPDLSDRFTVKMSGTIPYKGNSQNNVGESLRKDGIVAEKFYPYPVDIKQDEYFQEVPQEIKNKAKESLKFFTFNHEWVKQSDFLEALKYGTFQVCVDPSSPVVNGLIQPSTNYNYRHAELLIYGKKNEYYITFNSYDDSLKKYNWKYKFGGAKRYTYTVLGLGEMLTKYEGQNVKGDSSAIYRIVGGLKHAYLHWFDYLAFDGGHSTFTKIDQKYLDLIPLGEPVDITTSKYWEFLKDNYETLKQMSAPDNIVRLESLVKQTTGTTLTTVAKGETNSFIKLTLSYFNMLPKKFKVLGSSADPEKFSRTLKNLGFFIMALGALKGIDIPQTQIDLYITAILSIYTGCSTIYFGILRAISWLKSKGYIK